MNAVVLRSYLDPNKVRIYEVQVLNEKRNVKSTRIHPGVYKVRRDGGAIHMLTCTAPGGDPPARDLMRSALDKHDEERRAKKARPGAPNEPRI